MINGEYENTPIAQDVPEFRQRMIAHFSGQIMTQTLRSIRADIVTTISACLPSYTTEQKIEELKFSMDNVEKNEQKRFVER